jgi:hypothetical protein
MSSMENHTFDFSKILRKTNIGKFWPNAMGSPGVNREENSAVKGY